MPKAGPGSNKARHSKPQTQSTAAATAARHSVSDSRTWRRQERQRPEVWQRSQCRPYLAFAITVTWIDSVVVI